MDLYLILGIILIPLLAHFFVNSCYNRYNKIKNEKGNTGFDVAREILDKNGLKDIYIVEVKGSLSDHYDPNKKVVRLSSGVYHGETIAAASIAAHEVGHAIQDKNGYIFMKLRSLIFPLVSIATKFSYIVIFIGLLSELANLFYLGIALVSLGLLFQLITLPVEFDASKRAKRELEKLKIVNKKELAGTSAVLNAAALTYVAGVLASALELLRLIMVFNNKRR